MLSPSLGFSRKAPPVRPSRSLEGLEKVVPPPRPPRPELRLNKPLPSPPPQRISTTWSDDTSTIESFGTPTPRDSRASGESFPIFVSTDPDDLVHIVDQTSDDPMSTLDHHHSLHIDTSAKPHPETEAPGLRTFLFEERYAPPPTWSPSNQSGPNHYFREKKWDFFPELATPSAINSPVADDTESKRRKNNPSLLQKNLGRWNSSERGVTIAHEVRDSIRSYVHRNITKKGSSEKSKQDPRPLTAPDWSYEEELPKTPALTYSDQSDSGSSAMQQSYVNVAERMKTLSVATDEDPVERCETSKSIPMQRPKQLAVPLSPYQQYGAAVWDKNGSPRRVNSRQGRSVRFPRYRDQRRVPSLDCSTHGHACANATPPLSPPIRSPLQQSVKALQVSTNSMLGAIGGAKRKMSKSKADKKRAQLKSKIRLIGPVNPYTTYGRVDPWDF